MIQNINVGATANDHTGDPLRNAFIKVNQNFADIDAILQDVLTTSSVIPISQISGLQTILTNLQNNVSSLNSDVADINTAIGSINDTLNEQNISITDLYSQLTALQTLVNTKIGEAPIDGLTYGRKDGAWVEVTGGATGGPFVPYQGATSDVDLGNNKLTARDGIVLGPTSGPFPGANAIEIGTEYGSVSAYRQFLFRNYYNLYQAVSLQADPENGIYFGFSTPNYNRGLSITEFSSSLQAIDSNTSEVNQIAVEPDRVITQKFIEAGEGFKSFPFTGNLSNTAQFGTFYSDNSNFRQIKFINSGDDITYSSDRSVSLDFNIDTGLNIAMNNESGSSANLSLSDAFINFGMTNYTANNNVIIFPEYTGFTNKVIGDELFELAKGIDITPFPGNPSNYFRIGTSYGSYPNFKEIAFQNIGDGISFSEDQYVSINANIEEGINFAIGNGNNSAKYGVGLGGHFLGSGDGVIYNNFSIVPEEIYTDKKVASDGGLYVKNFPGSASNFFNLGSFYGGSPNFRQILFSNYGDDIDYSSDKSIIVSANIEEGFSATVTEADGQLGQIAVNYGGVNLQVNNNTGTNLIQVFPNYTYFSRRLYTPEGFEGNYVQFNTAATETDAVGKLKWNDTDGVLEFGAKGGNVNIQIGQELVSRVVNKSGGDLLESEFRVVRVRSVSEGGAQGQRLAVKLAQANNDFNSAETLGVVTETILNNQEGFITTFGEVKKIDTTGAMSYDAEETWVDGDLLYLSPYYPGYMTNVKPIAPEHMVVIGYVVYAHAVNGKIFVKIQNGYELDELHNVRIESPLPSQTLSYNSDLGVWQNNDEILLQTKRMYNTYRATTNSIVAIGNSVGYNLGAGQTARGLTGDAYERQQRSGVVSLTGPNAVTSYRLASLHFTLDGLEYFEQTFGNVEGMTDSATRAVHGIFTDVGVLSGNVEYNTLLNLIGVCKLSTSTNWHVVHNDNSGLATTIDLGSNFPSNVTKEKFTYRITPKGTNNVDVTFTRHLTGAKTTVNITTNMPSTAVLMTGKGALNTNTAAVQVGMDFFAVTELFK